MNERWLEWLRIAAAALGGAASYLWGPWDALCIALVALVATDYITGVIKAAILKKLDSKAGFAGLLKKLFIFALAALGTVIDRMLPGANGAVRSAVMMFYIANEGLSIIENAGELGLPLPDALKNALARLKGNEKQDEKTTEKS